MTKLKVVHEPARARLDESCAYKVVSSDGFTHDPGWFFVVDPLVQEGEPGWVVHGGSIHQCKDFAHMLNTARLSRAYTQDFTEDRSVDTEGISSPG